MTKKSRTKFVVLFFSMITLITQFTSCSFMNAFIAGAQRASQKEAERKAKREQAIPKDNPAAKFKKHNYYIYFYTDGTYIEFNSGSSPCPCSKGTYTITEGTFDSGELTITETNTWNYDLDEWYERSESLHYITIDSDGYISGYSFWGERYDAGLYKKVTE